MTKTETVEIIEELVSEKTDLQKRIEWLETEGKLRSDIIARLRTSLSIERDAREVESREQRQRIRELEDQLSKKSEGDEAVDLFKKLAKMARANGGVVMGGAMSMEELGAFLGDG